MPATTAAQSPPDREPRLAPVVDLTSRRSSKPVTSDSTAPGSTDLEEQARRHWERVFSAAGVDLGGDDTVSVVRLVTKELERLVGGLLAIREGRGEDLPPNPTAGVDLTSAVEITGVLHDLVHAAETARKQS